jgi:hypothetical protein
MRTYNHHPQLCNQVLRLTEEERQNPLLVIKEFFECYHLNDFREILWNWMVEVITSEGSISSEGLERGNHIYFYEKMEQLAEACFIIRDQVQKELLKIEPVIQPTG